AGLQRLDNCALGAGALAAGTAAAHGASVCESPEASAAALFKPCGSRRAVLPWRSALVPVPVGPSFFLYALSEYISALARMCVHTYGDMWDHWDHPYISMGCWSQSSSLVPLSSGSTRR